MVEIPKKRAIPAATIALHWSTFATKIVAVKSRTKLYCRRRFGGAYFFGHAGSPRESVDQDANTALEDGRRMVEISKVPVICRRAFYADLATAGAAVGMGGAADAAMLAALQAAAEPAQLDPDYADLDPE